MTQINVTLSLSENIYKKYQKFCEENAVALSKSVENFMSEKINNTRK